MVKYVLSKSTVHENQLEEIQLIAGDNEILSKTVNQNIIRKYPKIFIKIKKIKNTKITHIYSAQSIELGDTVPCNVYHSKIGKKKTYKLLLHSSKFFTSYKNRKVNQKNR